MPARKPPTTARTKTTITAPQQRGGAAAGTVASLPTERPTAAAALPPQLDATPMFYLCVRPDCVGLDADGEIVLDARAVPLMGGIYGMKLDQKTGKIRNIRRMFEKKRARGWKILEPEWAPNGTSYVQAVKVKEGTHHTDIWTTCYQGQSATTRDTAGFRAWLQSLIDDGLIEPPARIAVATLRRSFVGQLSDLEAARRADTQEAIRIREQIAACDRWLDAHPEIDLTQATPATGAVAAPEEIG